MGPTSSAVDAGKRIGVAAFEMQAAAASQALEKVNAASIQTGY
jgi:hypothetical protein